MSGVFLGRRGVCFFFGEVVRVFFQVCVFFWVFFVVFFFLVFFVVVFGAL